MITEYKTGEEFIRDNKDFLDTSPYLAVFFYWDAPILTECGKINYAMACRREGKTLLAMKAEPYDLLLFGNPDLSDELLSYLIKGGYEIKNYLCASDIGDEMLRLFREGYGRNYEEALAMEFMEAKGVTEPSSATVVTATPEDIDEIVLCQECFIKDCNLEDKVNREKTLKTIGDFRVIKEGGHIVSMAKAVNATGSDMKITDVFTKKEYRGRGYARKTVNAIKNEILAKGKIATLNVDRRNPVTNHLYRSLGFRPLFCQGEYRPVDK